MTGPSERAVEAARDALRRRGRIYAYEDGEDALAAASDPALGEDAYVRLGDAADWVESTMAEFIGPIAGETWREQFLASHREGRL